LYDKIYIVQNNLKLSQNNFQYTCSHRRMSRRCRWLFFSDKNNQPTLHQHNFTARTKKT